MCLTNFTKFKRNLFLFLILVYINIGHLLFKKKKKKEFLLLLLLYYIFNTNLSYF